MNEIKKALLIGLQKFGRKKTFNEILTVAGFTLDKVQRIELASEFENKGLIRTVTYRLPFEIRAELSQKGEEVVNGLQSEVKPSGLSSFLAFVKANFTLS
jgi:hypothetical protein